MRLERVRYANTQYKMNIKVNINKFQVISKILEPIESRYKYSFKTINPFLSLDRWHNCAVYICTIIYRTLVIFYKWNQWHGINPIKFLWLVFSIISFWNATIRFRLNRITITYEIILFQWRRIPYYLKCN